MPGVKVLARLASDSLVVICLVNGLAYLSSADLSKREDWREVLAMQREE